VSKEAIDWAGKDPEIVDGAAMLIGAQPMGYHAVFGRGRER
jgi:hypothetical protein